MTVRDAARAPDAWLPLGALASALAIPAAPVLLVFTFLAAHVGSFRGTCGPYPTDIPAYPCAFDEYLVNFAEPFALAGLLALSIAATLAMAAALAVAWSVAGLAWWLARRGFRDRVSSRA